VRRKSYVVHGRDPGKAADASGFRSPLRLFVDLNTRCDECTCAWACSKSFPVLNFNVMRKWIGVLLCTAFGSLAEGVWELARGYLLVYRRGNSPEAGNGVHRAVQGRREREAGDSPWWLVRLIQSLSQSLWSWLPVWA
jgi:hypothetical protein